MRLREKTTATLLITIFLISAFAFAVIASPSDFYFTEDVLGEAGLVTGEGMGYSARLYIPGSGNINDDAKLRIPCTGTLGDLTFSYRTKVTGTDGELHPYGSINIDAYTDSNYDGNADYVIVQWEVSSYPPTGVDTWIQTTFGDTTRIHVVDATTGLELTGFGQTDAKTLADLKAVTGWSDYHAIQVKVAVGMWAITYPLEGFVDDVHVNDVTYDFEPTTSGSSSSTLNIDADGYTLEITENGAGSVTKNPSQTEYAIGQSVTLTATPDADWHFKEWLGDITGTNPVKTISMNEDKTATAYFDPDIVSIDVTPTSVDFGSVMMGAVSGIETVTVLNDGNVDVEITLEVSTTFYEDYLRIGGTMISIWNGPTRSIVVDGTMPLDLTLDLTTCTEPGTHADTLVVWAEEL